MIWWCVEHHAERYAFGAGGLTAFCWKAGREPEDAAISCRMVEALLIVKESGQWSTPVINAVALWLAEYDGYEVTNDSNVALRGPLAESILDALASVGGDSQ